MILSAQNLQAITSAVDCLYPGRVHQMSGEWHNQAHCVPEVSSAVHDCEQAGRRGCSAAAAPLATASRLSIATAADEHVPTITLANPSQGAPCVPVKEAGSNQYQEGMRVASFSIKPVDC